jgi:hypothetical protein
MKIHSRKGVLKATTYTLIVQKELEGYTDLIRAIEIAIA